MGASLEVGKASSRISEVWDMSECNASSGSFGTQKASLITGFLFLKTKLTNTTFAHIFICFSFYMLETFLKSKLFLKTKKKKRFYFLNLAKNVLRNAKTYQRNFEQLSMILRKTK